MKIYYSKIDWWFYLILLLPIFPLCVSLFLEDRVGTLISRNIFFVCYAVFFILFPISYVLKKDFLEIRYGFFIRGKIPYKNMKSICECKMSLLDKAPVMSRDCVKICLDTSNINSFFLASDAGMMPKKYTLVSPKNKAEFLRELAEKSGS